MQIYFNTVVNPRLHDLGSARQHYFYDLIFYTYKKYKYSSTLYLAMKYISLEVCFLFPVYVKLETSLICSFPSRRPTKISPFSRSDFDKWRSQC